MSQTNEQSASLLRCFRFPLLVLVLFGSIFSVPWICDALDLETENVMPFFMLTVWLTPMLAVLIISVWWIFFAGCLHWFTRFGLFAVLAASIAAGFHFSVRKVELTSTPIGLIPRLHFVWNSSGQERVVEFEKQQPGKGDDLPVIDSTVGPEDFPSYRGTKQDGDVRFAKLQTDWIKAEPTQVWRRPCGDGYSGIAVAGNIVVTLEQRKSGETEDQQEVVACYDRATGRKRWAFAYDAYYVDSNHMGDGPRSTPTIHNKLIFSIGATGDLLCLNVEGKKQWSVNVLQDAKAKNVKWGLTGSPLIVDDLVVAHAGIDPDAPAGASLIAYEQATGKKRWQAGNRRAGYSSPQLVTLAGVRQILLFDGEGLVSYEPITGKELWNFPWVTDYDMNSIQPVVVGNDGVFISSELNVGCALVRVTPPDNASSQWKIASAWKNKNLAARFANPVTDGKHIFGLHNMAGVAICLDASTGKIKWKRERFGPGQLLLTNGVLIVVSGDQGEVALVEADGTEYKELARHRVLGAKTWNTPALAGDQLFVRNQAEIVCLKLLRQ